MEKTISPSPLSTVSGIRFPNSGFGGFTVLEFIIVLVVIGILAASVSYRFFSTSDTAKEVSLDQVVADIQYTQMLAAGTGAAKSIAFGNPDNASYTITGQSAKKLADGVTTSSVTITFNSLGEKIGGDATVSIGGRSISVLGITGKVVGG